MREQVRRRVPCVPATARVSRTPAGRCPPPSSGPRAAPVTARLRPDFPAVPPPFHPEPLSDRCASAISQPQQQPKPDFSSPCAPQPDSLRPQQPRRSDISSAWRSTAQHTCQPALVSDPNSSSTASRASPDPHLQPVPISSLASGLVWLGLARHDALWPGSARHGLAWHSN